MAGHSYTSVTLCYASFVQRHPLFFEQNFDAIHVFQDLDLLTYEPFGHGVTVGVHMYEPFAVNAPVQWLVYRRNIGGQRQKVRFFHEVGGLGAHTDGALDLGVGHLGAPPQGLKIEIEPVTEGTSRKEVALYVGKKSFNTSFSIGISHTVGYESHGEDIAEGLHLGSDLGIRTGTMSNQDAGVVNRTPGTHALHEEECLREEVTGFEAGEAGVVLNESPSAVSKDKSRTLGSDGFTAKEEPVGRGVVLSLLAGSKGVGSDSLWEVLLDAGLTHQAGETAVGDIKPVVVL